MVDSNQQLLPSPRREEKYPTHPVHGQLGEEWDEYSLGGHNKHL